ncbi:hypothetical protein F5884DRAFT_807864 [Xylogone sp. PMI_703]|nr:hypothetical protein F5884DRAFT_807864 [Xylogone sp. PMI_703]
MPSPSLSLEKLTMSYPHALSSLTPREAVADGLYRALLAFDRNDPTLLKSAIAGEDILLKSGDREVTSLAVIEAELFAHIGSMDTTHTPSNIRIDLKEGGKIASLTANAVAQHCPPGRGREPDGPKYLVGGEYQIELILDEVDGLWKIRKWIMNVIWSQGDASIMERPS